VTGILELPGTPAATQARAAARATAGRAFRVALTFDAEHPDRPSAQGVAERLLDELDRLVVPASFFIQGRWAEAYPTTARRIGDGGHLVGSHSHYHARMHLLTDAGLREDIADAERSILDATGLDPRPWFRCPFGAGVDDERVQQAILETGYRHVGWNVLGEDWPPERTGSLVEESIVSGAVRQGDGAVVLLHAWPDRTLAALIGMVARLRDAGAQLVRLDELDPTAVPALAGE
jgi:peptidoglycan/xylan/chitin deacetylase (PgdA/CDA1 family)